MHITLRLKLSSDDLSSIRDEAFRWTLYQQLSRCRFAMQESIPLSNKPRRRGKKSQSGEIKEKQTEALRTHSCIMAHFHFSASVLISIE